MATLGKIEEFDVGGGNIYRHMERLEQYFKANAVDPVSVKLLTGAVPFWYPFWEPKPAISCSTFALLACASDFAANLEKLACTCNFGGFLSNALRDCFVWLVRNSSSQKTIGRWSNLSTSTKIALNHETAKKYVAELNPKPAAIFDKVQSGNAPFCARSGQWVEVFELWGKW